ncbi:uncharacterized protein LOC130655334 [Hydractinia symbiolongicarpus]|uniref:uncharacterized protein LOC130655334 n=1 Tax=Hydractinia symbiolongicarpus TaxID=13093 RepID=UPI0025503EBF|nr:uncharacterized protein LOC130655334 [Hydractinia symbiolongicarpus]
MDKTSILFTLLLTFMVAGFEASLNGCKCEKDFAQCMSSHFTFEQFIICRRAKNMCIKSCDYSLKRRFIRSIHASQETYGRCFAKCQLGSALCLVARQQVKFCAKEKFSVCLSSCY